MTITVQRKNQTVFEHEISSFALSDALSVQLTGGYTETGLQKDVLYTVVIYDGEITITKLCTLVGYQFNVQTYQQTTDGITQTITGVTNKELSPLSRQRSRNIKNISKLPEYPFPL